MLAAVSDGLDGYLAKHFHWTSELGKILDPLADKLLLVAVFVEGAWLRAGAVVADRGGGGARRDDRTRALIFRLWFGPLHGRPTLISKINTGAQLLYVLLVLLAQPLQLRAARDCCERCGSSSCSPRRWSPGLHYLLTFADAPGICPRARIEGFACASCRSACACPIARYSQASCRGRTSRCSRISSAPRSSPPRCRPGCAARTAAGKTHLLQAVCARRASGVRAGYVPLAEVAALGAGVLEGLAQLECLCLDDVDHVSGRIEWERGLFALLRELAESGRPAGHGRAVAAGTDPLGAA